MVGRRSGRGILGSGGTSVSVDLCLPSGAEDVLLTSGIAQCLWKDTTHVGMGKATTKSGATYIVARYTPPGNMMGQKPY